MKLNVLHLTHTDIRTDSRILKQVYCLSNEGLNVVGVGIDFDEGSQPSDLNKNLNLITVNLYSNSFRHNRFVPKFIAHIFIFIELFFKLLAQVRKHRPEIIHCHDTFVLPIGVLSKLIYGSKLIYDAHELESKKAGLNKFSSLATLLIEKICWGFTDALIVVSQSIGDWYFENFSKRKMEVILNSPMFDKGKTLNNSQYLRDKFSIPQDRKIFVYVGLFGVERNIQELIEVFSDKSVMSHVVFIGYGELEKEIVDAANLHDTIHYHPGVKHDELVSILSGADYGLCLIPNSSLSDYYCLPNKLFEYIFSKIPVLASNLPEISKLVLDNNFGFVSELDAKSISNEIKKIETSSQVFDFDDEKLRPFSWQEQEKKLISLYCNL
jgi:glycosyltransferase involved in cell wall biosynthesis